MKRTPFYRWTYTDPESGARRTTGYRMQREDALQRFPDAEPIEESIEWRNLPESMEEWDSAGKPRPQGE